MANDMDKYTNQISKHENGVLLESKDSQPEELQTETKEDNLQYNIKATRALDVVRKDLDALSKNEFMKTFGDMKTFEKNIKILKKTVNDAYDKALDAWDKTKNN